MKNPRISVKERNLIKGAIRRVFSRSDLRRSIIDKAVFKHEDETRKRVKTWCKCAQCGVPTPKSYLQVDHIQPIVPLTSSLEEMSWDEVVNNIWCDEKNLQALCEECHNVKSKAENKKRREYKKERKNER